MFHNSYLVLGLCRETAEREARERALSNGSCRLRKRKPCNHQAELRRKPCTSKKTERLQKERQDVVFVECN
jgi:hypothetical protein